MINDDCDCNEIDGKHTLVTAADGDIIVCDYCNRAWNTDSLEELGGI